MKKVIVTVGPPLLQSGVMKTFDNGNYIFRINGAHCNADGAAEYITEIRKVLPEADILIDLPGNKIRTKGLEKPVQLSIDRDFILTSAQVNFQGFYKYLKPGDEVYANDSVLKFIVREVKENKVTFTSHSEGELQSGKGLHIKGAYKNLPFMFDRDRELIDVANKCKVTHIGLSFVRTADDINEAKELIDAGIEIIAKVETGSAVDNLNDILQTVDHILVDRGDLSTEVGLVKIPGYQRYIVERALFYNKRVFLATQFLKNMEEKPVPTIAEVIDLYNTFKMGVFGIQLSEETAIGKYPKECLRLIDDLIAEIDSEVK